MWHLLLDFAWALLLAIGLVAAAAAAVLGFNSWLRRRRLPTVEWEGAAFNVDSIAPRIQKIRNDYLLALHSRPHPRFHPANLLISARNSLRRFSYFKHLEWQKTPGAPARVDLQPEE